jgi:glycosyltransferase involved in cell wall biosynthesis
LRIVLVTSSWYPHGDLTGQADGFDARCLTLAQALRRLGHELSVVAVAPVPDARRPAWAAGLPIREWVIPQRSGTRFHRLERLVERVSPIPIGHPAELGLWRMLSSSGCDLVVFLTSRRPDLTRHISARLPTILFAEERFSEGPDGWGWAQGRFGELEATALRHAVSAIAGVGVISSLEREWAEQEFGLPAIVVPHSLDDAYWQERQDAPAAGLGPRDVFVIGNFGARRNAAGLREVIDRLSADEGERAIRIAVASGTEAHPLLRDVPPELMLWLGAVDDPRPYYRSAAATLVPSQQVRGVKTTILQGWLTGCPVVATEVAAASLDGVDGVDLLSSPTPDGLADALHRVVGDQALQKRLSRAGSESYAARHSAGVVDAALDNLLHLATTSVDTGAQEARKIDVGAGLRSTQTAKM